LLRADGSQHAPEPNEDGYTGYGRDGVRLELAFLACTPDEPVFFHSSRQEAMQAPPEKLLYLACLHEGTSVEAPDFLAVVDAEGRVVHETPMRLLRVRADCRVAGASATAWTSSGQ